MYANELQWKNGVNGNHGNDAEPELCLLRCFAYFIPRRLRVYVDVICVTDKSPNNMQLSCDSMSYTHRS